MPLPTSPRLVAIGGINRTPLVLILSFRRRVSVKTLAATISSGARGERPPRDLGLKNVERRIDGERLLKILRTIAAVAQRVGDHPRMVEQSRVARAEPERLVHCRLRFRVPSLLVKNPREHVARVDVSARGALARRGLKRFVETRIVVGPEERQLARVCAARRARALDELDEFVLPLRFVGATELRVQVAERGGVLRQGDALNRALVKIYGGLRVA